MVGAARTTDDDRTDHHTGPAVDLAGRQIPRLSRDRGETAAADIWLLPLDPAGAPFRFFASPANDTLPMFSPDGHWIAYASNESGATELYVQPFPKADAKWRVSSAGTIDEHAWSRDGKKLFFRSGDGQHIMAASITVTNGTLDIGRATPVLQLQSEDYPELSFWGGLSLSPDDQGFALAKYTGAGRRRSQSRGADARLGRQHQARLHRLAAPVTPSARHRGSRWRFPVCEPAAPGRGGAREPLDQPQIAAVAAGGQQHAAANRR